MKSVDKIEETLARGNKFRKEKKARYPYIYMLVSFLAGFLFTMLLANLNATFATRIGAKWQRIAEEEARQKAIESMKRTHKQFYEELLPDVKYNIQMLQCYIWYVDRDRPWRGSRALKMGAFPLNLIPFGPDDILLKDALNIPLLVEIKRIHDRFTEARKRIATINSPLGVEPATAHLYASFFEEVVSEAIGLVSKLSTEIGDESYKEEVYLNADWKENVHFLCEKFRESQPTLDATGEQLTISPYATKKHD